MRYFALGIFQAALASATCYEPSPPFPPPQYNRDDPILRETFKELEVALSMTVSAPEFNATSFSVEVTSVKESLWSNFHTALKRNPNYDDVDKVDGDTLYRIASITKAFTTLGILYLHRDGEVNLDDSVDEYIPELKENQNGSIPWKDITLRTLATQLSGIPREFAQSDLINLDDPTTYGLPPVSKQGLLECDEYGDYKPCGRNALLNNLKSRRPLFAPKQKSTYSNLNFELLGIVIENVSGQTFESYISEHVFQPLGMKRSSLSKPPDNQGIIPIVEPQYWDVDEGIQAPTGGIYSSSSDLSRFLRYVLANYNGITEAVNWFHPASYATGLQSFTGMPWEIFRTGSILPNSKRPVTFVTKAGGLPGYTSVIASIPEYGLGITVLIAGDSSLYPKIGEAVTVAVIRAAENIAIRALLDCCAGTYTASHLDLNSSVTLRADQRGLTVTSFISNGTDILSLLPQLFAPQTRNWFAQLVPTLLFRNEDKKKGEIWRLVTPAERSERYEDIWDPFCITDIDPLMYAGKPLNEFVFWGEDDRLDEVELTAFKVRLQRDTREKSKNMGPKKHGEEPLELRL